LALSFFRLVWCAALKHHNFCTAGSKEYIYIVIGDGIIRDLKLYIHGPTTKGTNDSAARTRETKARKKKKSIDGKPYDAELIMESDVECTGWTGGISHILSDSEDEDVVLSP
jgi:hypothetical protein